jgi:uncharacterized protein YkwD
VRPARLAAAAALLVAITGGGYAARTVLESRTSTGACPLNALAWKGRVTGVRLAATAPVREARIVTLINAFRRAHGLRALRTSPALAYAARAHSADMQQRNYFAHDGPDASFVDRLARYTPSSCIAENIAWGTAGFARATGVVSLWRSSPGHRHVMLLPWVTRVGVGVRTGSYLGAAGASIATADFSG